MQYFLLVLLACVVLTVMAYFFLGRSTSVSLGPQSTPETPLSATDELDSARVQSVTDQATPPVVEVPFRCGARRRPCDKCHFQFGFGPPPVIGHAGGENSDGTMKPVRQRQTSNRDPGSGGQTGPRDFDQRRRHRLAAQPVVEQEHRIGPPRDAMSLGRTPDQRLQMRPLLAGKEATLDHARSRIDYDLPVNKKSETQGVGV